MPEAIIKKCETCGGDLKPDARGVLTCEYCGRQYKDSVDGFSHELEEVVRRRQLREFSQAEELCRELLTRHPESSELNWQALLSSLGVVYVKEEGRVKPTFFSYSYDDRELIENSEYYRNAVKYAATEEDRNHYIQHAKVLDGLLKEFFSLVDKQDSYDIFISFKQTVTAIVDGEQRQIETDDYRKAKEIYEHLSKKYKVFFSPVSIGKDTGIEGEKYEPRILKALQTCKAMILLGSKKDYLEAPWVQNEWRRYQYFINKGKKDKASLILGYEKSMPALPVALKDIQLPSFDWYNAGYLTELDNKLGSIMPSAGKDLLSRLKNLDTKKVTDALVAGATAVRQKINPKTIKRIIIASVIVAVCVILAVVGIIIGVGMSNSIEYKIDGDSVTITGTNGFFDAVSDDDLVIDKYKGKPITTIESGAFERTGIKSVTLAASVTSIESYAFDNCVNLERVTILGDNVYIGVYAFAGCKSLKTVSFGPNASSREVTSGIQIRDNAFSGCGKLQSVTFADCVTKIGSDAFKNCNSLTSINYLGSVADWCGIEGLGYLMSDARTLNIDGNKLSGKLVIPTSVSEISDYAFAYCDGITEVEIPDGVTSVGEGAFIGCDNIVSVTAPALAISSIPKAKLKTAVITSGDIGGGAFKDCTSLTSVQLLDGVTYIGSKAFSGCTGLTSLEIADSVTDIERDALEGCNNIATATVPAIAITYLPKATLTTLTITSGSINSGVFDEYGITSLELKDGVIYIGASAFSNCKKLTSVTIGDGVTYIGEWAFLGCDSLSDLKLGGSIATVSGGAFEGCSSLTSIVLPDSVTSVESNAFKNCTGLTSVTIGYGVTSIGGGAFEGCANLETVYWYATECGSAGDEYNPVFKGCKKLKTVIFTIYTRIIPSCAFYGCDGITGIDFASGVESIGMYAFSGCAGLTGVEIPDSVTTIGECAFAGCVNLETVNWNAVECMTARLDDKGVFWNCDKLAEVTFGSYVSNIPTNLLNGCAGLTSVVIPDSVTSIGSGAFYNCSGLTSIVIPDSVTSIGDSVFYNCAGLTSVKIGNSVTSIGIDAFANCVELTSIDLPDSVTEIREYAFYSCTSLASAKLGNSVTSIGEYAFANCQSLKSIKLPDNLTSIGYGAFDNCTGLTSIEIPGSVTSIERNAFYNCAGLTSVTFKNTSGWWYSSSSEGEGSTEILSSDLSDTSIAANYLTSEYSDYYWKRSDESN